MRQVSRFLTALSLIGCGTSAPGALPSLQSGSGTGPQGTPAADSSAPSSDPTPSGSPTQPDPTHPDPTVPASTEPVLAPGCAYAAAIEPLEPAPLGDACFEERLADDGNVISRIERRVSEVGDQRVVTSETWDVENVLSLREVTRTNADGLVTFESTEHLTFAPTDTLPYTYGQPATFSIAYEHDAAGHVTKRSLDLAMDGTVDDEERWVFTGEVATEHTTYAKGEVQVTELTRPDGQPRSRLDYGGYGMVWTYDAAGLLLQVDTVSQDLVTESTHWQFLAANKPLKQSYSRFITGLDGVRKEEVLSETTWTYDEAGKALASEGWGRPEGFVRTHQTEWDEAGREVLYVENTEEPSCHRYERTTNWSGDVAVDSLTTCDGTLFEHVVVDVDSQGRPVHTDRVFVGNPSWTVHERDTVEFDACGAQVFREHFYDDTLTMRDRLTLDAQGRIVARTSERKGVAAGTTHYTYDAAGHVTAMGERQFSYDGAGRLVRVDYGSAAPVMEQDEPPTVARRLSYECGK
jgi:YD repeat-containing protein